jgi:peptidoglycan/LPS O-acetylase OafA/YrhL
MLVNLQLLRFLAALPVITYHLGPHVWASGIERGGLLHYVQLFGFGGVDVFFVISGFIMWHTTHDERGPAAAWRFLRRRVARVYSGYWPFLLLAIVLWFWFHPQILEERNWTLSALLLSNPFASMSQLDPATLILPVAWTLIYEVYFYFAFFLLIAFRQKGGIATIWLALLVVAITGIHAEYEGVFAPGRLANASMVHALYLSPMCAEFLLGCLIGEFYRRRRLGWPLAWLGLGLAMLVAITWINAYWLQGNLILGQYLPLRVLLMSVAASSFVLWVLALDQQGKQFLPRVSLLLGGSSYALYLSHTIWLQWLYDIGIRQWLVEVDLLVPGMWLLLLLVIVLSAVFYQYVERPLHSGFRRLLGVAAASRP